MRRMLTVAAIAFALGGPAVAQTPPVPPPPPQQGPDAVLDDIVVTGGQLDELAREFVDSLAAPARGRGLARWEDDVCLGVVNFRSETAHQLIDHISDVAREIGVALAEPGCQPNVLIVGTTDGQALARALVGRHRRDFRYGYTRSNRGSRALGVFQTSEAPVRWWHISLLYNVLNDELAMRLPGQGPASIPQTGRCLQRRGGLERCNDVTDRLVRSVIIVDMEALPDVSFQQLADYLAVLTLAQVEPDTDYAGFDTVLKVMAEPQAVAGLTEWDRNYLRALYSGDSERVDPEEQAESLADRMRQAPAD